MLYELGLVLSKIYGPFRLFNSHLFLIVAGITLGFFLTFLLLPRVCRFLPVDRGREFAIESHVACGKPTGSGVFFISIFIFVSLLVVPFGENQLMVLALMFLTMLSGYLDDRSRKPWSEYLKGALDLALALTASLVLIEDASNMWLPFTKSSFDLSPTVFIPLSTVVIWTSINATNCSDGVDGLSSTLVLLALMSLGVFLYFVVGHEEISAYLLLPHYSDSAKWAIMIFTLVGTLAGYLWHNAYPSSVLMGDAGSRALGFFIGVSVMNSGNPFLLLIVSSVLMINGGTGLVKVGLLRFFKIRIFHNIRFPLHDHFRHVKKWSGTQVLIRFAIIQILLIIVMFGLLMKVR